MSQHDGHAFGPTLLESAVEGAPARPTPRPDSNATRFQPLRSIGRGGMGEVTLVHDHEIDRTVAVKRLRANVEHGAARFSDEIRTIGQLEHPNITAIHDVGVDHDGHYFVMPFVDGETLEAIIARLRDGDADYHRRFTYEVRVDLWHGVLKAIHYAHAKGVIHRDIKPANVIVGPFGEVVLMDWGIAKKRGETRVVTDISDEEGSERDRLFRTRHGTLLGTPAYMSPEQACGDVDHIDERSDIYSLCVVFYELLTLSHYLPGHTTLPEMLAAVISTPHVHAAGITSPHQPPVPVELGWFIQQGLEKDPALRYQDTTEMLEAFRRALAGNFEIRCYMTLMKRGGVSALHFIDRRPRTAVFGGLAVAAAAVFGLVSFVALLWR